MSAEPIGRDGDREESVVLDRDHPWPGLASFDENGREFFRGRDRDVDELFRLVQSSIATVLYGLAGLGKTSLVQAGLFPRLREANALPVSVRLDFSQGSAPLVEQVFESIARDVGAAKLPPRAGRESLWEYFHRREVIFWNERHRVARPVLVFDQFEEIFTLGKDIQNGRDEFLVQLADLADGTPPRTLVSHLKEHPQDESLFDPTRHRYAIVLSLREDYIAELEALKLKTRLPAKRLVRMKARNAREVVDAGAHLVDPDTADAIVRFVATGDPESQEPFESLEVDPALLSVICAELNEKRDAHGRIDSGLLERNRDAILAGFYEDAIAPFAKNVRRFIEDGLLTPNGYRASVTEDQASGQFGVDAVTIRRLVGRRLVRIEARGRARRVELTHDLLTGVIAASRDRRKDEEKRIAELARDEAEKRERQIRARLRLTNVALAIAGLMLVLAGVAWLRYTLEKRRAAREAARWSFSAARDQIAAERYGDALAYLANAIRSEPENVDARRLALSLLLTQLWYVPERSWSFREEVQSVSISGDAKTALAVTGHTVHVIDLATGAMRALEHVRDVSSAQFTCAGERIVTADQREVVLWDTASGKALQRWTESADVKRVVVSADGTHVAVVAGDGVNIHDEGSSGFHIGTPGSFEQDVRFSADGTDVAVAWASGGIQFARYDANSGKLRRPIETQPLSDDVELVIMPSLDDVAVLDDHSVSRVGPKGVTITLRGLKTLDFRPEDTVVMGIDNGHATNWHYDLAKATVTPPVTFGDDVQSAQFNGNGSLVVTTSSRGYLRVWTRLGSAFSPLIAEPEPITAAQVSDGGEALLIAHGHALELRRTPGLMDIVVPDAYFGGLSPDEATLLVPRDGVVEVLDPTSGLPRAPGRMQGTSVLMPQQGSRALIGSADHWTVFDFLSGRGTPVSFRESGAAITVSADGRRVMTTTASDASIVYDATTGAVLRRFERPSEGTFIVNPRLSADGQRVLFQMTDMLAIGSVGNGQVVRQPRRYTSAEFDRSGTFVIATEDINVHILDAATLRSIGQPFEHAEELVDATFNDDAATFVAMQKNGIAQVWQREPPKALARVRVGGSESHAQFAADGERLLVTSVETTNPSELAVRYSVWNARTGLPDSRMFKRNREWRPQFQGRGRRIVAASAGVIRVIELAEATPGEAELLAELAEHVAGMRFDEGSLVPVDPGDFKMPRDAQGEVAKIATCFLAKDRTLTPFTTTKLRDYIAQRIALAGAPPNDVRHQLALAYPGK